MTTLSEDFRLYVVRREHRKEWLARANSGDEVARECMWAVSKWMKDFATEPFACACCNTVLSPEAKPQAVIVFIPVIADPEKVTATAGGVCLECSKHDDMWIAEHGARRDGYLATVRGIQ
jgi:hypothetical protein